MKDAMTKFEKVLIGVAEQLIVARDCPHASSFPTTTPCQRCIDRELEAHKTLVEVVTQEGDRRFLLKLRRLGAYPKKDATP